MITKSGIDSKNFEFESAGQVSEDLYLTYTSKNSTALYVLENSNGMEVCISNVGARIVSIMVPDKNGEFKDVVLGFDTLKGYIDYDQKHTNFIGALIGRYANRISGGRFDIGDNSFKLPINNDPNCLHGGPYGWAYQTFEFISFDEVNSKLVMKLVSPDGDMGFPGKVELYVTYQLFDDNSLHISYDAKTNLATVINITNHSYFNLSGNYNNTVLNDRLFINARQFTPLNEYCCPTGEIRDIEKNSPFDFYGKCLFKPKFYKCGKVVGQDINAIDQQIKMGNGYDHNYVLLGDKSGFFGPKPYDKKIPYCAKLQNEESGITLDIYTTEPGVQLYDSIDLDGSLIGKNNIALKANCGLCLETQHFADSPNKNNFPSTLLKPNQTFHSVSVYKFS